MTWKRAIGQDRVKAILQRAIIDGRIPHAYLFWGKEGVGKDALAIEFAKSVNCQNTISQASNGVVNADYCDNCNSCKMFNQIGHPNLQFIFATPASKSDAEIGDDKQIDEISKQLKLKSEDYYHKMQVTGGSQIRISSIRHIKRNLSLSAGMPGRRVIIVSRADEMSADSANAFLKTLEEPQENTTIILTSSRKETLLPTILSRCQSIHVPVLTDDEITSFAVNNLNVSNADAEIIAAYAEGSVSRAKEFTNSDMQSLRVEVVEILRTALTARNYKKQLIGKINDITKDKDKRKAEYILNLFLIWFMDVIKCRDNPKSEHILNRDMSDTLVKFTSVFGNKDFSEAIQLGESAILKIKRNVPLNLIFIDFCLKLREIMLD